MRGLQISCATVVADGMVVHTQSDAARQAQDGVLELLLINHPLDCPVCDRGGECPLQDTTLAFGPGESRFVEEKRHWEKPIPISDLVLLDRERCIQCGRCTRFADEIAGDALISFGARGDHTEVITFPDDPFSSYFSGNTVQICPVGALTATPYRFKARPWDLSAVETSCTTCSVHCRGALQSSSNQLVRLLGVDSEPVNHGWLCDKGRFGYEVVNSEERVRQPDGAQGRRARRVLVARGARRGRGRPASARSTCTARSRSRCSAARAAPTRTRTSGPASRRASSAPTTSTPSSATASPRTSRSVCPAPRSRTWTRQGDRRWSASTSRRSCRSSTCACSAPPTSSACRSSSSRRATRASRSTPPSRSATLPGEQGDGRAAARRGARRRRHAGRGAGQGRGRSSPVATATSSSCSGGATWPSPTPPPCRPRPSSPSSRRRRSSSSRCAAATSVARSTSASRPASSPAGDARRRPGLVRDALGHACRRARASMPAGSSQAAGQGRIHALLLLGHDPHDDCPDRALAEQALNAAGFTIAIDAFVTDSTKRADVFLPVTMWGEKIGSVTNVEGRVQRAWRRRSRPRASSMPDWRIAAELALRLGEDFDLETVEEVQDEIAAVAPAFAGVDAALLRRARDGAVLPIADHRDELVLGPVRIPVTSCVVGADRAPRTGRRLRRLLAGRGPARLVGYRRGGDDPARAHRDRDRARRPGARRRRAAGRGGRGAGRAATRAPPFQRHAADHGHARARRLRSPPRDGTHALRRGDHGGRVGLAAGSAARAGAARAPAGPRPDRRRGRCRGEGHVRRAARCSCRCGPTPRSKPAPRTSPSTCPAAGWATSSTSVPRSPTCAWSPGRDPRGGSAVQQRRRRRRRAHRHRQDDRGVRDPPAASSSSTSGSCARSSPTCRTGSAPTRPARSASCRRWPTASSSSSRSSRSPTRPTRWSSRSRRTSR